MKKRLTTLMVAAAFTVTSSTLSVNAQPDDRSIESTDKKLADLTGQEIFEAFYFGAGTGVETLSESLQEKSYDEFVANVEKQRPVDETNRNVSAITAAIEEQDPGHFDEFRERITSGDPFEFRDQLGATTEVINSLQKKAKEQTSTPGQVKPDAAVPVWATALAVQWAGAAYQYALAFNAVTYATVAVLTKAAFWDHTASAIDVDQLTAEVAPKLAV